MMAMFRNLFLLLLLFLLPRLGKSAEVVIDCRSSDFPGTSVYVVTSADYVTRQPVIRVEATTNAEGGFTARIPTESTLAIELVMGPWVATMYAEPGRTYRIRLVKPQENTALTFSDNPVIIEFDALEKDDPNYLMGYFERKYRKLFADASLELAVRLGKGSTEALLPDSGSTEVVPDDFVTLLGDFFVEMTEMLTPVTDPFATDLLRGAMGRLDLALGRHKKDVFIEWMVSFPDVNNPELTALFHDLHYQVLADPSVGSTSFNRGLSEGNLGLCMSALQAYPLVQSDEERALIVLLEIKKAWQQKERRAGLVKLLDELRLNVYGVGALAGRMAEELKRGTTAATWFLPELTLIDEKGDRVALKDLKDELVYLSVIRVGSAACEREMISMEPLYKKFGKQVRFLTIVMDTPDDDLRNYLAEHRSREWSFLNGGSNPLLRHYLRLRTIPSFFLIRPDGRLHSDYSRSPVEGVHDTLVQLLKKNRDTKVKVWD